MYDEYDRVTARYYDAAYEALNAGADVAFYRELARETGGPVLELGCGTGRALELIASDGLECTGLDASPAMLERLRERLGDRVRAVLSDMRDFDLAGERFALIFSAFRPFQHLLTVEDQLRCLARVRAHLARGGCFAFDVFRPRPELMLGAEEPEAEDLRFQQDGDEIVRYARISRDHAQQILRVRFRYERCAQGRAPESEHTMEFGMRWFFRYELEHLLVRAGFSDVEIHGDFDRSPVGPDTPDFVVIAR